MKTYLPLLLALAGINAHADGFVCKTTDHDLIVKVFHQTQPELGTRNAAVLILSDPSVQYGRKTIASFTADKATLANSGATYEANVDLRVSESNRKGERVLGTKLGMLDSIIVDVDFSYSSPLLDGEETSGQIKLVKRNGEIISEELSCARYLKN